VSSGIRYSVDQIEMRVNQSNRLKMDQFRGEDKMRVDKCPICGGETKEDVVEVQENIKGKFYIIKGVKAEVCVQCGERMYSIDDMTVLRQVEKVAS
jgi:YgiT-type zinc finger domain-containing protein